MRAAAGVENIFALSTRRGGILAECKKHVKRVFFGNMYRSTETLCHQILDLTRVQKICKAQISKVPFFQAVRIRWILFWEFFDRAFALI